MSITETMEQNIYNLIEELEKRIKKLEEENVGTTNCLYELQIQLDMMNESEYSLQKFTLGE